MTNLKRIVTAAAIGLLALSAQAQAQSQGAKYRDYGMGKTYTDRDHTTREALDTGTW
jgi:hypothetical protein